MEQGNKEDMEIKVGWLVGVFLIILILSVGKNVTNGKEEADRLQGRF